MKMKETHNEMMRTLIITIGKSLRQQNTFFSIFRFDNKCLNVENDENNNNSGQNTSDGMENDIDNNKQPSNG